MTDTPPPLRPRRPPHRPRRPRRAQRPVCPWRRRRAHPAVRRIPPNAQGPPLEIWRAELKMRGLLVGRNEREMWSKRLNGCLQAKLVGVWAKSYGL